MAFDVHAECQGDRSLDLDSGQAIPPIGFNKVDRDLQEGSALGIGFDLFITSGPSIFDWGVKLQ
jgi:hypothetical protein